jgi:hypothetical protein
VTNYHTPLRETLTRMADSHSYDHEPGHHHEHVDATVHGYVYEVEIDTLRHLGGRIAEEISTRVEDWIAPSESPAEAGHGADDGGHEHEFDEAQHAVLLVQVRESLVVGVVGGDFVEHPAREFVERAESEHE